MINNPPAPPLATSARPNDNTAAHSQHAHCRGGCGISALHIFFSIFQKTFLEKNLKKLFFTFSTLIFYFFNIVLEKKVKIVFFSNFFSKMFF